MSNNPAWLQSDAIETQDVTPLAPNTSSTGANQGISTRDSFGETFIPFFNIIFNRIHQLNHG